MKVLFTGASSFTGRWFALQLAEAGHQVTATFTGHSVESYQGLRARRVADVLEKCQSAFNCRFGDDSFLDLFKGSDYDLLCHHGADVTNYKSADFNVVAAVSSNCHRLNDVLAGFKQQGGQSLLLTGSVFEGGEGAGSDGLPHFSPYGLSKSLTSQLVEYACEQAQIKFAKFVIPNPFGPFEDERFTAYLMKCWRAGLPAAVRTPDYVRDNIHVSLLAAVYTQFAERTAQALPGHLGPSGYVESQGVFAERLAREMRVRTGWECELELATQLHFDEPRVRINTSPIDRAASGWSEKPAWDQFAAFYETGSVTA